MKLCKVAGAAIQGQRRRSLPAGLSARGWVNGDAELALSWCCGSPRAGKGQVTSVPCHLPGPWKPPSILELGGFGMEPGSLNQHGTDPSIRTGRGFGKPSRALPALPLACPAMGVLQSRSHPLALMKL